MGSRIEVMDSSGVVRRRDGLAHQDNVPVSIWFHERWYAGCDLVRIQAAR
jgi:hypothetical protein